MVRHVLGPAAEGVADAAAGEEVGEVGHGERGEVGHQAWVTAIQEGVQSVKVLPVNITSSSGKYFIFKASL